MSDLLQQADNLSSPVSCSRLRDTKGNSLVETEPTPVFCRPTGKGGVEELDEQTH